MLINFSNCHNHKVPSRTFFPIFASWVFKTVKSQNFFPADVSVFTFLATFLMGFLTVCVVLEISEIGIWPHGKWNWTSRVGILGTDFEESFGTMKNDYFQETNIKPTEKQVREKCPNTVKYFPGVNVVESLSPFQSRYVTN